MHLTPTSRRLGHPDPSFGSKGVFVVQFDGYDDVEPGEIDSVRALDRAPDGSLMLALGFKNDDGSVWLYGLARLTPDGKRDPAYGAGKGFVLGSLTSAQRMMGAQPWITPDGKTVVVLRDQASRTWTLARHESSGAQDLNFGATGGYINLDAIRPPGERVVVKGFIIAGPESGFYFIGSTREPVAERAPEGDTKTEGDTTTEGGSTWAGPYAGAVVFRFDGSGRLDTTFADRGYVYVDVPLNPSGRITDAVVQDDGKLVLSTATTSGNSRIVRLLADTGTPDPDFGKDGQGFVEVRGDSADRIEIEKLAWSSEAGLWGLGRSMLLSHKGVLIALDGHGEIREDFNGGNGLMEITYDGLSAGDGFSWPVHIHTSGRGVTVAGGPRRPFGNEPKALIVGRHGYSGALDPSFGDADETGTPKGFYTVDLDRKGANFFFLGIDLDDEQLTLELLNGDGGGTSNPDLTTVERYVVSQASREAKVAISYEVKRRRP